MPYVEVIPQIKLPPRFSFLDYQISADQAKQLTIGQLVKVPFRNQNILAIVIKIKNSTKTPRDKIKSINKIIGFESTLTKEQIELFNFLGKYYYSSPASFIKSLVPHPPLKKSTARPIFYPPKIKVSKNIEVQKILNSKLPVLLTYSNYLDRLAAYKSLAKKILTNKSKSQLLIIVPTKKELAEIAGCLLADFTKTDLALITSQLTNYELYQQWQKIQQGKAKIIIGTKIAAFTPFNNLKLIILDNEHNENHHQAEINPRYEIKTILQKLSQLHKLKSYVMTSFAPSLEIYYNALNQKIKIINLKSTTPPQPPTIIDLSSEHDPHGRLLPESTLQKVEAALKNQKKVLFFINRRGYNTFIVCQDCGWVGTCPNCQISLNYHQGKNILRCHRCDYQIESWLKCPTCQSPVIRYKGSGTERLKVALAKEFADEKIAVIDSDNAEQIKLTGQPEYKIFIGTKLALDNLDLSQFNLIISVLSDILFNQGDFHSTEYCYQILKSLTIYPETQPIFQTFLPENIVLKNLSDQKSFYQTELAIRQKYQYPPYLRLAKLILQNPNQNSLDNETKDLAATIKKICQTNNLEMLGPIIPFPEKIRQNYRRFIIIKYHQEAELEKIMKINYNQKMLLEKNPIHLTN